MNWLITLSAAGCASVAASLLLRPRPKLPVPGNGTGGALDLSQWRVPAALLAALSLWSLLGGWFGLTTGVLVGIGLYRWLAALPGATVHRQERARAVALPVAVELMAACMSAGGSPVRALRVVADQSEATVGRDLVRVALALEIGGSPEEAWQLAGSDLTAVSTVMCRSAQSGAPVALLMSDIARDMREQVRAQALSEARALGVRSAGPLGVCFLPAFVLVGIVPLVIGLVQTWL